MKYVHYSAPAPTPWATTARLNSIVITALAGIDIMILPVHQRTDGRYLRYKNRNKQNKKQRPQVEKLPIAERRRRRNPDKTKTIPFIRKQRGKKRRDKERRAERETLPPPSTLTPSHHHTFPVFWVFQVFPQRTFQVSPPVPNMTPVTKKERPDLLETKKKLESLKHK